ncbi:MAG: glutamine amidotransferase-related protein [bacterium]
MATPETIDIGLLLCDDVPEDGRARFGDYTGMFDRAIKAVDGQINLTPYNTYKGALPKEAGAHDGYLISGSGASVFEDKQWIKELMEFVRQCHAERVKTVGICFGHQLIAHALGGETVRSDNGWGFGIHSARLTENPDWIEAGNARYKLVVIHQDQVVSLPAGFTTIASNDFCPNSMITDHGLMLGIQGHPEFNKEYCAYRAEFRRQTIGEDKYQETIGLLNDNETDSNQVFGWISRFFRHQI